MPSSPDDDLFVALYPELRRLAAAQLRGRSPTPHSHVTARSDWQMAKAWLAARSSA
jgi:hypothetical protein